MAIESDRFRIAVALTALRFKPPDQSFMSYTLELCSYFPPTSAEFTSVDSWRSLALKLERDIAVLKEKYEAEQIKTSTLGSGVMFGSSLPPPNSSLDQSATSKKKPKKKSGPTISCSENTTRKELPISRPDLRAILEDLSLRKPISWAQPQQSLFSALDSFMQLTALPEARLDLLSSVTLRTVNAIAKQITDVISLPVPSGLSDSNTLNCLGIALHHVLATSLSQLDQVLSQTTEPIIAILDRTIKLILVPIVHAFNIRSEAYLGSLFLPCSVGHMDKILESPANSHCSSSTDIRVDMLDLFRKIFSFLDGHLQSFTTLTNPLIISHTFRASLILQTIRELDGVLSVAPTADLSHDPNGGVDMIGKRHQRTRPDRVKKLAKKDSLWYLCTVLHILLCEPSNAVASQSEMPSVISQDMGKKDAQKGSADSLQGVQLLSEGISDALLKLITRCKRPLSSSLQSQKYGVEIEARHERIRSGLTPKYTRNRGGLECVIEENRMAQIRGGADGDIHKDESCARMLRDNNDVGADAGIDVGVDAGGQHRNDSGSDQPVGSVLQGAKLHDHGHGHGSTIELDEVGYGMLLGVLERYWVWSRSWEL